MRFLLSLVISSFFFSIPIQGKACEIPGRQLITNNAIKTPGGELTDFSIIAKNAEAIIGQSRISISQCRFFSYTNFINNAPLVSFLNFLPWAKDLVCQCQHFKPIRLKLIFPEHYYW